jgi:hypothetical protein
MRDNLWRGKDYYSNRWVYGSLIAEGKWFFIAQIAALVETPLSSHPDLTSVSDADFVLVDPRTVGQYTGRNDLTGRRIFEGDIAVDRSMFSASQKPFVVMLKPIPGGYGYSKLDSPDRLQVIGNIHDSPWLVGSPMPPALFQTETLAEQE